MNIDLENITNNSFVDELQKLAFPEVPKLSNPIKPLSTSIAKPLSAGERFDISSSNSRFGKSTTNKDFGDVAESRHMANTSTTPVDFTESEINKVKADSGNMATPQSINKMQKQRTALKPTNMV